MILPVIDQSNDLLQEHTIEGVGDDIPRLLLTVGVPEAEIKPEIGTVPVPPVVTGVGGVPSSTGVPDTPRDTNKRQYCDVTDSHRWVETLHDRNFF